MTIRLDRHAHAEVGLRMAVIADSALKAILFADAAQYSRHVVAEERWTLDFMQRCFAVFRELAPLNGGQVLKTMGDGAMVEFGSAREAMSYALAAQERLVGLAADMPPERQIRFRIGIHLGEVQHLDGDVYGHIVNVASRLEHLAEPGGICISEAVFEQVRQSVAATYRSLGRRNLKGIPQPVIVYRVHSGGTLDFGLAGARDISVSLIERVSVSDSQGNELTPKSIKARALIGYLVLNPHHHEIKDRLLALMWSNQEPAQSLAEYRQVIRQARTAFQNAGPELFHASPEEVGLFASRLHVDLLTMSEQLTEGAVAPGLAEGQVSPDHIMAGVENVDQVFDAWLKVTRHRWRERLVEQLETFLGRFSHDRLQSKHAAMALLAIDPTHEPAAQALMKIFVAEGKNAAALRIYQALADVLADGYGIEPGPDTKATMQSIRAGGEPASDPQRSVPSAVVAGRLPVIEVRNFLGSDGEDGKAHLLAGFRAEIISCLIKFRDWVIIEEQVGRGSPESKGGTIIDYRLEATLLPPPVDGVINLTLIDAVNNRFVWSERYSMTLSEWGSASGMVARKVAAVLDIYLSAERVAGHVGRGDLSLGAYDDWLRGENLLTLWQPDAELEAEKLFRSTIEQMPRFAPAYSSLASIYNVRHLIVAGFRRDPALEAEALKLAQKAVQIDPRETRAHLTLAWSYTLAKRYEQADIHYDLAYELNPNNPRTLLSCAHGLAYTGRVERAEELATLAIGLTPIIAPYQWAYLAGIRFICADYAGSVAAATMGADSLVDTLAWKAAAQAVMGEMDEARETAQEFLAGARSQWIDQSVDDASIVEWMLSGLPIKDPETCRRLTHGLELAGLSTPPVPEK
jgi:class 3 adenylate cyclase/DNA-binding SARP family transcriptional activator